MRYIDHYLRAQYEGAFQREQPVEYPEVDELEKRLGYAVDRARLEAAARVLACPIKVNPPNWQHGRVLYALARAYLSATYRPVTFLDVGTAKGFSACVLSWAIADAGHADDHRVVSVDIVDPESFVRRNSIVEAEKFQTVAQFVAPFIAPGVAVEFHGGGSAKWLIAAKAAKVNVGFAFIDGKHSFDAVSLEAYTIAKLQQPGDVMLFDDVQLADIDRAVMKVSGYKRERLRLSKARRAYAWLCKT